MEYIVHGVTGSQTRQRLSLSLPDFLSLILLLYLFFPL